MQNFSFEGIGPPCSLSVTCFVTSANSNFLIFLLVVGKIFLSSIKNFLTVSFHIYL